MRALVCPFLAALLCACDASDAARPAASSGETVPASSGETEREQPRPVTSPAAAASAAPKALELLGMSLTSEVKKREPADRLLAAEPGMRVWAHVRIRNRTGDARRVSLVFRVDGDERSTVDLKVEPSWSFRTWGYNTLRGGDKRGTLTVELRDEAGALLGEAQLPIEGKARRKAK